MRVKVICPAFDFAHETCKQVLGEYTAESISNHAVWRKISQVVLPANFGVNAPKAKPLAANLCKSELKLVYEEAGLASWCGKLDVFSARHFVQDPALRPEQDSDDVQGESHQPALLQSLGSSVLQSLDNHVILIVQHIEHVRLPTGLWLCCRLV